jgi:hypothetical protein
MLKLVMAGGTGVHQCHQYQSSRSSFCFMIITMMRAEVGG